MKPLFQVTRRADVSGSSLPSLPMMKLSAFLLWGLVVPVALSFTLPSHAATKKTLSPSDNAVSAKSASDSSAAASASGLLPSNAVARVNGMLITQAQLDQAVATAGAPDTPALRTSLKEQLIAREVFRQAAEKRHYDAQPQVIAAVQQAKTLAMTQAYLRDAVQPVAVSDADVQAKYDAIVASLGENEYKPSVIVVKDATAAQSALDQLKKGTDFAQIARQSSIGPSAAQGGALGWVSFKVPVQPGATQNWPQPLAEALVQLPQGAVSSAPIQVGDVFWILRVDEKRPTQVPKFDDIRAALRSQLQQVALQKATTQVVAELMKSAQIQQ